MPTLRWIGSTFVVIIVAVVFAYEAAKFIRVLPDRDRTTAILIIKPNSTVRAISNQLEKEGILKDGYRFRILSRLMHLERKLKPGEYRFFKPSSAWEALKLLKDGKTVLHRVTFKEGITMREMANILAKEELVRLETFLPMLTQKDLLTRFQIPANSFEGFLFPETYFLSKSDEPVTILQTMTDRFKAVTPPANVERARSLGFSLLQWVTLASIIEKETGVVSEQPTVSSVFHNRLKKKMRLQSDPTVIYGVANFDGNLRKRDLLTKTPYNTYMQSGLPPGPIANPGASALRAAIYPASTNYLYFVAKKDGTHAFTPTYEEHQRNVSKYQLNGRPIPQTDRTPRNP